MSNIIQFPKKKQSKKFTTLDALLENIDRLSDDELEECLEDFSSLLISKSLINKIFGLNIIELPEHLKQDFLKVENSLIEIFVDKNSRQILYINIEDVCRYLEEIPQQFSKRNNLSVSFFVTSDETKKITNTTCQAYLHVVVKYEELIVCLEKKFCKKYIKVISVLKNYLI